MKSDFATDMIQLEEALKNRDPYAVLVVDTTGLDYGKIPAHSPTRVQVVQYEYNDEKAQYEQSITFNKLVAANMSLVNAAIKTAESGGFDVFAAADIDATSYKAQIENPDLFKKGGIPADQKVLTQAEFKQAFEYVMNGLQRDNTMIIANGKEHSLKYLDKIDCADQLNEAVKQGKVIDQPRLGAEYLHQHGRDDLITKNSVTLEKLRNALTPVPNAAKQFDKPELAGDFKSMSKEEFLKSHKVSERAYDIKVKDDTFRETKLTSSERIDIINNFVTLYGREKELLEPERITKMRENEAKRFEMASERGKQKYQNNSLSQKLKTLTEMGKIDKDAVLKGNSEYQNLMDAIHGDKGNKGMLFVHIATSGLDNPKGNATGLPMQIVVHAVDINKDRSGMNFATHKGQKATMKLPPEVVLKAEEEAKNGGFDVFKDAGIDINEMKSENNKNIVSEQVFIDAIDKMFRRFDPKEYSIVALSGGSDGDKAFFQKSLESICTFDIINAPVIDFTKAVQEYSLLTVEGEIPDNKIFGNNAIKSLGIRDIASSMDVDLSSGTSGKVVAMMKAAITMYNQYLELNPDLVYPEFTEKTEDVKKEPEKKQTSTPISAPVPEEKPQTEKLEDFEEVDEPEFAEEDGDYDDVYVEELEEPEYEDVEYVPDYDDYVPEEREQEEEVQTETKPEPKPEPEPEPEQPEKRSVHSARPECRKLEEGAKHPERPKPAPESSASAPTVPAFDANAVITALLQQNANLVQQNTRQSEIIAQQSSIIAKNDERYFALLQQQNELIKSILFEKNTPAPEREHIQKAPKARTISTESVEGGTIDKLEQIKDNIDSICDDVPDKVKNCLKDANASISEGQAELEKDEKTKE